MSDDLSEQNLRRKGVAAVFILVFSLLLVDVVTEYGDGVGWTHIAFEILVLVLLGAGIWLLLSQRNAAERDLSAARVEAEQWRAESQELLRGLSVAIEHQFARWDLTKSETEIGMLLLKGLSHKEIAEIRQVSERTVREQSRAIYRKSGLSGRSALSAFFLEDLLVPDSQEQQAA
jgi:DNA-binding CsgD family transcriptional regulator